MSIKKRPIMSYKKLRCRFRAAKLFIHFHYNSLLSQCPNQLSVFDFTNNTQQALFNCMAAEDQPLKILNYQHILYQTPSLLQVIVTKTDSNPNVIYVPYPEEPNPLTNSQNQYLIIKQQEFKRFQEKVNGEIHLSVAQMKLEEKTVNLPSFVNKFFTHNNRGIESTVIESINLWHFKSDRVSTWHYDGHDNFLFLLKGVKTIWLLPPNSLKDISASLCNHNTDHYLSSKNFMSTDNNHAKNPHFHDFIKHHHRSLRKTILQAHQCIFIPRGWWHYVESQGESIAINVWGNSISQIFKNRRDQEELLLKHVIKETIDQLYGHYLKQMKSKEVENQALVIEQKVALLNCYIKNMLI